MNLLFESTKVFEKELSKLPTKNKKSIIDKINKYCSLLEGENKKDFYKKAFQPFKALLKNGESSSLYVLKSGKNIRIILTVDDDPLFEQVIITLIRIVRHSSLEKAYKGILESIYQKSLNSELKEIK